MKYWKLERKQLLWIGAALGLLLLYYLYKRSRIRKLTVQLDPESDPVRSGFNPTAEAKFIHDELSRWNTNIDRRGEVFSTILAYNDNELRAVHNEYLRLYRDKRKKTLAELIRAEWIITPGEILIGMGLKRTNILRRLRRIGAA